MIISAFVYFVLLMPLYPNVYSVTIGLLLSSISYSRTMQYVSLCVASNELYSNPKPIHSNGCEVDRGLLLFIVIKTVFVSLLMVMIIDELCVSDCCGLLGSGLIM